MWEFLHVITVVLYEDLHQLRCICPIIHRRIDVDLCQTVMYDFPGLFHGPFHMVGRLPSAEDIESGYIHHDHIRHLFKLHSRISDVGGQAGGIIPYPPLMIIIVTFLDFHIGMLPISEDAFRVKTDRTALQVPEFPLRRDPHYLQSRIVQYGPQYLLTDQPSMGFSFFASSRILALLLKRIAPFSLRCGLSRPLSIFYGVFLFTL